MKEVNKSTKKQNLYLPILSLLKKSTNLKNIQSKLSISKQNLNNYLRELKKRGFIIQKGKGWYEVVKEVNKSTKYGNLLSKDSIRGHAYIWTIKLPQEIKDWDKRIDILKSKDVHFNLVGAKENTPRIKVLGRKVWLCNDHLRIFDKGKSSYYGLTAKEARYMGFQEVKLIVGALNRKLGLFLKPSQVIFNKEHYSLINNDLAIEENKRGNIWRIKDDDGEWLLIDDSLGEGGELENIGKKAFQTNIPLQKWWNDHKDTGFKVTPSFILEGFNKLLQNQQTNTNDIHYIAQNYASHVGIVERLNKILEEPKIRKHIIKKTNQSQTKLGDFL